MQELTHVLVTGRTGQLSQEIYSLIDNYPNYTFTFTDRSQLDFSQPETISVFFADKQYDIIINCVAYTAVDKAESEADLADLINHQAVKQLALIAHDHQCKLIHISTDYVFDGTNHIPYIETDEPNPQGVYGKTKLKGEQAIQQIMSENALIIRTSWVYSRFGSNFVKTMMRLGEEREQLNVIFDQLGTPTYANDLAKAILYITQSDDFHRSHFSTDLYHYSNEGVASWYDFAKAIFELSNIDCNVNPIETKDYPTAASRPCYSLMNKSKIKNDFDLTIPYWKDALKDYLK